MNPGFEFITDLQYKVRSLTARVEAFTTGEKYVSMRAEFDSRLAAKDSIIRELKAELSAGRRQYAAVRKSWSEVIDDMQKDHEKQLREKDREKQFWQERALTAERRLDEAKDNLREKIKELYQVKTELEDEKGKNRKLISQINRDHENSSISSSLKPNHRKIIPNSREKTGRKPGGQPGHEGHTRRKLEPTNTVNIPAPQEFVNNPQQYAPTGKTITKQIINLQLNVIVDEYRTPEFRDRKTGQRVHASFPSDVKNEVNYGGSVKSVIFLLNNHCCVSMDKISDLLKELTNGQLQVSKGMISGLGKEFAEKTQQEQAEIFADLLLCPVMNIDFTTARVDGHNLQVAACAAPGKTMYFAREHKGHEGVAGTPAEDYQQILVHDHDKTFYNYGGDHQECLAHVLRYLLDSMGNEPGLEWNRQMRELLQEAIRWRNSLNPDAVPDPKVAARFEERYREILNTAKTEYEYEPPGKYYRDGYNLYLRLEQYMHNHLLFLRNPLVPANNNLAERRIRVLKRKIRQVMTLRCFESLDYLCQSMSVIASLRDQGKNLFTSVAETFD